MRSSKSNPAKYARNYKAISQRRMTQYDDVDEEKEMQRLRNILKHSQDHLRKVGRDGDGEDDGLFDKSKKKRRGKSKPAVVMNNESDEDSAGHADDVTVLANPPKMSEDSEIERARALLRKTDHLQAQVVVDDAMEQEMLKPLKAGKKRNRSNKALEQMPDQETTDEKTEEKHQEKTPTISNPIELSNDLLMNDPEGGDADNALILPPKKKKQKKSKKQVELTPQEIRQAKQLQKKTERKLKQLTIRAEQKKKRVEIYDRLKENAISAEEIQLLSSSSTLGKRVSKKEQLKALVQKERAGIPLTEEERELLYRDRGSSNSIDRNEKDSGDEESKAKGAEASGSRDEANLCSGGPTRKRTAGAHAEANTVSGDQTSSNDATGAVAGRVAGAETAASFNASSFAAQMMSSLSTLKDKSVKQKEENERKQQEERERRLQEEEERQKANRKTPYVPSNPIVIQTAATKRNLKMHQLPASNRRVLSVSRPEAIKASRYELPVAQMEFEVMDAIRNNDVTIICSETGSGKSTQIPQMLYESGFSLEPPTDAHQQRQHKFQIGITQPRRVAAVSTAKRVCYEMGQGDGQTIKSTTRKDGNLVAYQTRYETAGLGETTSIKFMTDGILLRELQSDLLLRKYSVIVLDEFHERNLNSDCIAGLISAALPLRRKAAEESGSGLVPLKLVIMSATLRVEDFVNNDRLFGSSTPAVVRVPGRTHPVTIHHSKVTELDNYEDVAFRKVCKIHRKLPKGGILLFLTGKQDIVKMVNRLRKALSKQKKAPSTNGSGDIVASQTDIKYANDSLEGHMPRDMDDEEVDGDLFRFDAPDDNLDDDNNENDDDEVTTAASGEDTPQDVLVLPLYSMLSTEEQAKVFQSVPDGTRLICVATNIAETSITIPNISYVVDCGRHKCRNYDAKTGVASFDIQWISKAAANQRAGRAGRTGPGHCYRLYSSSMFSRHMDDFELPEVLSRPLEDVVLAMKAMKISDVSNFPFPTPPAKDQIDAAVKLLANLGCLQLDNDEDEFGDGMVTPLGAAVATLPLGVRCGKMLLVGAHAGVLDYTIVIVSAMSEKSPFVRAGDQEGRTTPNDGTAEAADNDQKDDAKEEKATKKLKRWVHKGGDVLATMLAVGAYTYAGRGAGGMAERMACRKFCGENGLNPATMDRIQTIRAHLARLAKTRMTGADGVAAKTGGIPASLAPPNKLQERLLIQVISSGLLDNVAMLAPLGSIPGTHPFSLRSAFLNCSSSVKEPIFMDQNSVLYSRDARQLPQWVCYDTIVRKTLKDGTPIATMKNITPVDPSWLGTVSKGSRMLSLGAPLSTPRPFYDREKDEVLCHVETTFGNHGWEIPAVKTGMYDALQKPKARYCVHFQADDSFRYFARFLLEGKVLPELEDLPQLLNDSPATITGKVPAIKTALLVSALSSAGIDNAAALRRHWATVDDKFLFKHLKVWVKKDCVSQAKKLWIHAVNENVKAWKSTASAGNRVATA